PDNIMIRSDGRPVLIDFGAVKTIEQRTTTVRTFLVAKPNYSPPEQTEDGARLDRTADIYALGAVLYRAFAGAPPVDAERARLREVAFGRRDPYVTLAQAAVNLAPEIVASVDRALAFRPEDRPPSIDALRSGLGWRDDMQGATKPLGGPERTETRNVTDPRVRRDVTEEGASARPTPAAREPDASQNRAAPGAATKRRRSHLAYAAVAAGGGGQRP